MHKILTLYKPVTQLLVFAAPSLMLQQQPNIGFLSMCSLFLICSSVRADFGAGTITFDESSYTVYDWSDVQSWVADPYDATTNPTGFQESSISSSTLSVSDDQVIGLDQAFRVTTSNGNVYVRFGFDESARNTGGTVGSLDSGDTPAVLETTYGGTTAEQGTVGPPYVSPNDIFAYTSAVGGAVNADYIESGYESQAGNFFVRARKDNNGDSTETNDSGDQESWTSFIIDYAGAAVSEATGEIWDIDAGGAGAERFAVTVTGNSASVTDGTYTVTENSPTGLAETNASSLDAKPWQFSFGSADGFTDIDQIQITRFSGAGYKSYFPLAFNNFNPVSATGFTGSVPEPSTLAVFAVGSVGVVAGGVRRRRKQKS